MEVMIPVSPRRLIRLLIFGVVGLAFVSIAGILSADLPVEDYFLMEARESFIRLFALDAEANIPTWYSSALLLFCSILLATIAHAKKSHNDAFALHWRFLSVVLLYLSVDEAAIIHEMATKPMRAMFGTHHGLLHYSWVIPGAVGVIILVLAYSRFLLELPTKTGVFFCVAGAIFAGGAIGVEAVTGWYFDAHGEADGTYKAMVTIEEVLEMLGIVVFIYALLEYMSSFATEVRFHVDGR